MQWNLSFTKALLIIATEIMLSWYQKQRRSWGGGQGGTFVPGRRHDGGAKED